MYCFVAFGNISFIDQDLEEQVSVLTEARDKVMESLKKFKSQQESSSQEIHAQLQKENEQFQEKIQQQVWLLTSIVWLASNWSPNATLFI